MTRGHLQNYNQAPWRDGFAADLPGNEESTSILDMLNEAARQLLRTGYAKCDFTMKLVAGQREYAVDPWISQYVSVTYLGQVLGHTTLGKLDTYSPSWRNQSAGTPTQFYFTSDTIGFFPTPAQSDDDTGSVVIKADSVVPDLVAETDKPRRLPARFHDLLAIGAARLLSVADTENEAATRRIPFLNQWFNEGADDLEKVVQQRDLDQSDQIVPQDYRGFFRR